MTPDLEWPSQAADEFRVQPRTARSCPSASAPNMQAFPLSDPAKPYEKATVKRT